MSSAQSHRARTGSRLLVFPDCELPRYEDFENVLTVVLIHGFTADASYMCELSRHFIAARFTALAFEYPCFNGIDYAARALADLLQQQDASLSKHKTVLVGHSMGGLVAHAALALYGADRWVRKLVTIGTPHGGTLRDIKHLQHLAQLGERLTTFNPRGYAMKSKSALQLMHADLPEPLLQRLHTAPPRVPCLSISGGHANLDFGPGLVKNYFANQWLQKRLSKPNDGLVSESSSDLTQAYPSRPANPALRHFRDYADYAGLNHTYLMFNQTVALEAVGFATAP